MKNYFDFIKNQYLEVNLRALYNELDNDISYKEIVEFLFIGNTAKIRKEMNGYITDPKTKHSLTQIISDRPANLTIENIKEVFINDNGYGITLRTIEPIKGGKKYGWCDNSTVYWYIVDIDIPVQIKVTNDDITQVNNIINKVKIKNKAAIFGM